MIILLPFPPSVNQYWRHVVMKTRRGLVQRTLLSLKGRHYRNRCIKTIRNQFPVHEVIREMVKVEMHLFPPDRRKRDIDNYSKGVLDALTHAQIWEDDYQVNELVIKRRQAQPDGSVVLRITKNADTKKGNIGPESVWHPDQHGTE